MPLTPPDPAWLLRRRQVIGGYVRGARMWNNLTQEALRDLSGVPRETIQKIENAGTDAKLSWLLAIAHALHLELDDLLAGRYRQ
ncbi:helix-turn-helix transcriptional regulator [Actinacidiphila glaucinigra]|uniref:helix-turn-helix domain-containing protein n=1 Tax=Actinacidiphila glaucinigra TaxID=235986 RepID=UPI00324F001D